MGKAKDLKKRVSSYFSNKPLDTKTQALVEKVDSIEHIITTSEIEAFLLEANLIKKHLPFYNIKLADDKSYPYIFIGEEPFPYVAITRRKIEKGTYFGPYTDATAVKIVLKLLRRIFPYQSIKNHPKQKCLYNHLGLCPCIPAIPENMSDYKKNITRIKSFLNGNSKQIVKQLEKERDILIKEEAFEKAGVIQKKIERINFITSEVYDPFKFVEDTDFYIKRIEDEKKSLEEILREYYPEIKILERIECYDISNIQGKNATGSMVVMTHGDTDKSQYRRFKIKLKSTPDDFFMMQEVLTRRLKRSDWRMPDLLVIDGGKGQVSSALEILDKMNMKIPLIGLAKREEIIVIPNRNYSSDELFVELKLPLSTPAINLLRRIRNEAHRFAITYHRLLRKKATLTK